MVSRFRFSLDFGHGAGAPGKVKRFASSPFTLRAMVRPSDPAIAATRRGF